ncbi:MAG: prolipoprotein diacylglyceryl transferase [Cyanobacteria bacterium]|jgi:phosphatidylglycerol:prolipoprotein diacylglycerol transferase|nr:prolipoprotein diacylglyceryl transferase [Cyanobacteria bacterium GSL.Bin21]
MYPPVDPIIVEWGPLVLRWYGVLMMTAIVVGAFVASYHVNRWGGDSEKLWDMLIWLLIPGFIGARLYYVFIQSPPEQVQRYLANPLSIIQIWDGGIHIFGGFIFGAIALWLYTKINQLSPLLYLDAIALALPLSQAIGRWGNFINQELYGPPTELPWGLRIDPQHRIPPYNDLDTYPESTRFQPLFLYESAWNFLGFFLLLWISRRFSQQLKQGDMLLLYLIWYPGGRFFIEFLRTDSWFFPGTPFNVVHILCLIAVVTSVVLLFRRDRATRTSSSD